MSSVQFFTPGGPANVRKQLDNVMDQASLSLRIAVCYFTDAGRVLMSRHQQQLNLDRSYFVACIDPPTDLDALQTLHYLAPGHVYIHLGGVTPREKKVGRALMHSKVVLAESDAVSHLWVGSHNFTARAINGANFEAAVLTTDGNDAPIISDAVTHLNMCRDTAELFNPADMDRYREIQRERWDPEWDSERNVLVIHAEAEQFPTENEFVVRIQIAPTELDKLIRSDRAVRLFLHPPGTLVPGQPVDYSKAAMWHGEITAVVRTELHPRHRGARGTFQRANYDIDVPDLQSRPILVAGDSSTVPARTQAVIRLDHRSGTDEEMYSVGGKSPATFELGSKSAHELEEIDRDMTRFFTSDSVHDRHLVFRPVDDVSETIVVKGYDETVRSMIEPQEKLGRSRQMPLPDDEFIGRDYSRTTPRRMPEIAYKTIEPKRPIDPYFYLSGYAIRGGRIQ